MNVYQSLLQPFVFQTLRADPETVKLQLLRLGESIERHSDRPPARWIKQQLAQTFSLPTPELSQQLWGLTFPNPIGLAAGLDKDGVAAGLWGSFGFGFAEVGTVTYHPQPGNPRPRLFRLPADRAGINRMGFNNRGAAALAQTLEQAQKRSARTIPLGINLGKSKVTPLEEAVEDYLGSFRLLQAWGDYFVINVSSPNTPGLRSLQTAANLEPILSALQNENQARRPLLLKISPDLAWEDLATIIDLVKTYQWAGLIATNTTIARPELQTKVIPQTGKSPQEEAGGLSGAPLKQRSTEVIRFIHQQTGGQLPIIGVGGVFTAADAWEKIMAGATLIQVYTGWIYEGPGMVKQLLTGLQTELQQRGLDCLAALDRQP
uniref:Dihydroorotate dehydrogenase (quinone) n=1 Tax=Cyanothece sp. (strain PCC 7425 / ATCC 29141) TaxID=395961 RepID=PYRD_CYAP4|nr:RecName: Full=Dihydroorotate dehydrogenase (quinone); AltName: Full=DHOdehase; Short=DHOD; Short=DHODase; AltName: Full=Dihydroorotate oxidase [Cyanothece sp. PCC 7425]